MEYRENLMELRTLRYFLAVAREENMPRAAEILHVTQPTLSKALRALEDDLKSLSSAGEKMQQFTAQKDRAEEHRKEHC